MKLIIVESPTKSRTIAKFLNPDYKVFSTYGHVRDLPEKEFGVDVEKNFKPKYVIPLKTRKTIKALKDAAKKAQLAILATDEDREGEAIAWHLLQTLKLDEEKRPYQRIVFHEITKNAIQQALENPRQIDLNLVNAQQARRILDRIVGYRLSPFLWKKVLKGLSAGRVQSVAVRMVVEREKEIEKFVPQEYWSVEIELVKRGANAEPKPEQTRFKALLIKKDGKVIGRLDIKNKQEVEVIVKELEGAEYKVTSIEKKESRKNPLPPFLTSTLQQSAFQKFRWPAKMTMQIAQNLYERGFITYHRTDSLNLSALALGAAKEFITQNFSENYWQARQYKTKSKSAQEAHEAIRPTYPDRAPDGLNKELEQRQLKLYDLIWRRFMASQMAPALFDATKVEITAKNYIFQASGQTLKFDGFLKIYPIKYEETELPALQKDELLEPIKLIPAQHFTQPPARYNEASLIRALEKEGIGRPSTYAPILSTIQERNYVEKDEKKSFKPTEVGAIVNDLLVAHFPEVVDIKFTANMERGLDKIAVGKKEWTRLLKDFYQPFNKNLQNKYQEVEKKNLATQTTDKKCPECDSPLVIRLSKYGKFYACSTFPKCRFTENIAQKGLGLACPKCQQGEIMPRKTKRGKIFYSCSRYPDCDFALWHKPSGTTCVKCGSPMIQKGRKILCTNKECLH